MNITLGHWLRDVWYDEVTYGIISNGQMVPLAMWTEQLSDIHNGKQYHPISLLVVVTKLSRNC